MANADATASLGLDLTDVAKALAKLPEMTGAEAEKAVAAMTRTFDRAAKEAKRLGDIQAKASAAAAAEAKKLADAQRAVQQATAKTAESASKLAGALNMVSPELGALVNSGKALADVFSVGNAAAGSLGPAILAVGAAAAVVGAAYLALNGDLERATATMQVQASVAQTVTEASYGLERARIAAAVATGQLTETEGRQQAAQLTLTEQIGKAREAQDAQRDAIEQASDKAERWLGYLDRATDTLLVVNPLLGAWTKLVAAGADEVFGLSDGVAEADKQTRALDAGLKAQEAILRGTAKANETAAAAIEARRKAEQAASKATTGSRSSGDPGAAAMAQADAAQRAAEQETAVLDGLADKVQAAQMARLDGAAQIDAAARAEIVRLDEIAAKHIGNAEIVAAVQAAQVEAITTAREKVAQLDAEQDAREAEASARSQERLAALITKTDEQLAAHAEARAAANAALIGGLLDLANGAADALMGLASKQAETNKKQARQTYAVAQGLAIADVGVKTAQAVMAVLATWAAFPPVAAALATAVAGMGALQIGKIAATQPTFHTGGVYSPDEGPARLRRGEGVLTSEATRRMGGEQGIAALNRGAGMQTQRVIVDWQDGAKGLSRTVAKLGRQRGAIGDLAGKTYSGRNWSR